MIDRLALAGFLKTHHTGRMLSGSKSEYFHRFPDHLTVYNANLLTLSHGKFWFGDLDLDRPEDEAALKQLAAELGEDVYLLREMDCRFDTETDPNWESAVAIVTPTGEVARRGKV